MFITFVTLRNNLSNASFLSYTSSCSGHLQVALTQEEKRAMAKKGLSS
jgi:hypothetical protein